MAMVVPSPARNSGISRTVAAFGAIEASYHTRGLLKSPRSSRMRGVGSVLGLTIGLKPGSSALDLPGSLRSLRAGARAEGPEYQAAAVAGRAAPAYTDI